MEGHFNVNLKELIEGRRLSTKYISDKLKIPEYALIKILEEDYSGQSFVSLKDIAQRFSVIFGEKIIFITEKDDNEEFENILNKTNYLKTKKEKGFIVLFLIFIIINLVYMVFISQNIINYREIISKNSLNLTVYNNGGNSIFIDDLELLPGQKEKITITPDISVNVKNTDSTVEITSLTEKYNIELNNFTIKIKNK
ncbi:MAG: hypothetical protein H7A30_07935 [Thermotogae bacterium]|nr:hypothetical protein [Thermotogota bacterium]